MTTSTVVAIRMARSLGPRRPKQRGCEHTAHQHDTDGTERTKLPATHRNTTNLYRAKYP